MSKTDNVYPLKRQQNALAETDIVNPVRAELIEILLDWASDPEGPTSEKVRELMARLGVGQNIPPIAVEHLVTRLIPVVNERLWKAQSKVRAAPIMHSSGLKLQLLLVE